MATPNQIPNPPVDYAGSSQSGLFIQNLGTNPLYVKWGTSGSTSDFNLILAAGGAANDGTGGNYFQNFYFGQISFAGTSPSYIAYYIINGVMQQ